MAKAPDRILYPLVTVGLPLYRSGRFLDTILENIAAIDYPNVEILVSDRHLLDDAADVLEAKFAGDARFRFIRATDGINWVQNFNLLHREARGKYVVIMPHDDSYPPGYIGALVAALEQRPDGVLAFGRVEQISLDGFLPTLPFSPPPIASGDPWTVGSAVRMLTTWQLWFAFRGLIRRDSVHSRQLFIRETHRNIRADIYWVFALALRGRLVFEPSTCCTKRFYRSSTGADWKFDLRQSVNACRVLSGYLRDHAPSRWAAFKAKAAVYPWCIVQALLPAGFARRVLNAWETRIARRR